MIELACCAFASSLEAPHHQQVSSTRLGPLRQEGSRHEDVSKYLKLARRVVDERRMLATLRPRLVSKLRVVDVCLVEEESDGKRRYQDYT